MNSFLSFLKTNYRKYANDLGSNKPGTTTFNNNWKTLAKKDPKGFEAVQHSFIKSTHYDPAITKINKDVGINITKRSAALKDVAWSMSVQHGASGANNIFKNAGVTNNMSDKQMILKLYAERSKVNKYFSRSSQNIKNSVYNRFQNELKDALSQLR